jgi:hypothetical protein
MKGLVNDRIILSSLQLHKSYSKDEEMTSQKAREDRRTYRGPKEIPVISVKRDCESEGVRE